MASQATIQQGLGSRRTRRGVLGAQAAQGRWAGRAWGSGLGVAGVAHDRQGALQAGTGGRQAQGAAGARQQARRERWARAAWALPGRAGWPWAVHSVHSACFWPGSTRYFLESNFFEHYS